eukprot:CAMPEP_0194585774 /NCGR_PEP_ID=MMETSP0292-20121207/17976_1 /TAXON_ID=39354 /ORGANISM="Heterosigma akashiwo, Strain CCMP2393" /LENGTH=78 /DNA_ID=CAMNT_0039441333 /DNA_START=54 /DNA_END=287 /DNA_ORIENTATION=-
MVMAAPSESDFQAEFYQFVAIPVVRSRDIGEANSYGCHELCFDFPIDEEVEQNPVTREVAEVGANSIPTRPSRPTLVW